MKSEPSLTKLFRWLATLPCAVLLAEATLMAGDAGVAALVVMVLAGITDQHNKSACQ